jgi:predicted RNase H-like HicB family nuclease
MAQTKQRGSLRQSSHRSSTKQTKTYKYTILIHPADPDETGYWVEVPALPGCFTQGQTIEECLERAPEAITGHLQSLIDLHQPIPEEPDRDDAVIGKVLVNLPVPAWAACPP